MLRDKVERLKDMLFKYKVIEYNDFIKYLTSFFILDNKIITENQEIVKKIYDCYLGKGFGSCAIAIEKLEKNKIRELDKIFKL